MKYKDYIILIPSRLGSTRLRNKPLIKINGEPLIVHVFKSVQKSKTKIPILVATDSNDIAELIKKEGGNVVLTNKNHESGSDRIFEALNIFDPKKQFNKVIHLQGDLPNVSDTLIINLANLIFDKKCIGTPVVEASLDEIQDPNVVKCVVSFGKENPRPGDTGKAIYFSRSKIPWGDQKIWHHIGLYAWDREILEKFISLNPSPLEKSEKLEQLRAIESDLEIKILITNEKPIGIDTKEDLKKFQNWLNLKNKG